MADRNRGQACSELLWEAMNIIGAEPSDIAAIGITNQRETTIVWDKNTGDPVCHAIWRFNGRKVL